VGVKLLKLPEVSAMTGLLESTLRFMRTTGYGPRSARVGRRVMYREDDVLTLIDEQFATDAARHCSTAGAPHTTHAARTIHRH
jgi:predicted DNA-binding transcriptional regulator AlpA